MTGSKQYGTQPWLQKVLFYSTDAFIKHLLKKKNNQRLIKRDKTFLSNDCGMLNCTKTSWVLVQAWITLWGWCTQHHQNQNQTRIYTIVCNSISKPHTKLCGCFWILPFVLSSPPLTKQVQNICPVNSCKKTPHERSRSAEFWWQKGPCRYVRLSRLGRKWHFLL